MATPQFARLLTVEEVAELLGVSPAWVRKKKDEGLPHIRLGDGLRAPIRFRIADIEAYVAKRASGETPAEAEGEGSNG